MAARPLVLLMLTPLLIAAEAPRGELRVDLSGVRNGKGMLLLCLTANAKHCPDCRADPAARTLSAPAGQPAELAFRGLAPGDYALSVMHDENGNARLDTMMRIRAKGSASRAIRWCGSGRRSFAKCASRCRRGRSASTSG